MNNSQENKKLNDKGFSLVELIIVIAIMAVLVGVLAPQYLQYVERSRQSADLDNWDSIVSALEIYAADPNNASSVGADATGITFVKDTAQTFSTSDSQWMKVALAEAGLTSVTMKSALYGNITVTATETSGVIDFDFAETNGSDSDGSKLKTALGRN